ncbi:hypothetical protein OIU77_000896 [Salix suchowensis]|uniref:Protein CROWDED NUCLEI 4-like n=1 Tax=Salix suchowensis TaxID=1278906 RepID=A0ABQ9B7Q9_9ROSI|nr:hypothetical protein OIU77_000896 [Salix suchowensis]
MASPVTPSNGSVRALSLTSSARVLKTPLTDEKIWKRLKEAGFDEESVKRRDKAALIAYIANLEAEMFDLQYHMGLLIMEKKEWTSKYDQMKSSAETADLMRRHDQASHLSALAEARKREESLKKALGVKKECISSMEKALHEMRTESAETKVAADSKLAEARDMVQDAQKKFLDAEAKLHAAEALQAEASRYHRAAERKLQEVEAREADLSRRMKAFKTDCDAKEKEIGLERQSLSERRKELEVSKENIEKERRALNYEKSKLELTIASLSQREEKLELVAEEDRLKNEKGKFETEWELIDEKREELRKEAERVAEEREAVSRLLKEERDSLRLEKKEIRDQHKRDVESLNHEREDFMNKMEQERSEWFNRIQKEHSDFLLGIEMQKRELESSIDKRREEIESHLRDKEKAFELEKKSELQHIASLREKAEKELEQATLEMKKLEAERMEINLDRERRDGEWAMLNKSIEELKGQTQKLEKQRQLLHGEREEIYVQIEQLKKLDNLKLALDDMEVEEMQLSNMESSRQKISTIRRLKQQTTVQDTDLASNGKLDAASNVGGLNSPTSKTSVAPSPNSARFSWIKRCTELVFKNSPEKPLSNSQGSGMSDHEDTSLTAGKLDSSNGYCRKKLKSVQSFDKSQPIRYVYGEPKVILEVPPKGDISKEACHVEYDVMEAANERLTFPISELAPQAEMKQVVDNSSLDDSVDSHNGKGQSNKRKRQEEDTINDSVTSTQEAVYKDQHATEEADVVIIDKIIKVSEVACEITVPDTSAHQEKPVQLQSSEKTSHLNISKDEVSEVLKE